MTNKKYQEFDIYGPEDIIERIEFMMIELGYTVEEAFEKITLVYKNGKEINLLEEHIKRNLDEEVKK
jgi:hypothetical protein